MTERIMEEKASQKAGAAAAGSAASPFTTTYRLTQVSQRDE